MGQEKKMGSVAKASKLNLAMSSRSISQPLSRACIQSSRMSTGIRKEWKGDQLSTFVGQEWKNCLGNNSFPGTIVLFSLTYQLEYGIYQVPAREVDERNNGSLFTMEEGGRRAGRARREKFSRLNFPARERDVLDAVLMSDRVHRASNAGC